MTPGDFNPDYILPGTSIGAYTVRTMLGYGSGSSVYEVESSDGNLFALKMSRHRTGTADSREWLMDRRQSRNILCLENLKGVRNVAQIFAHDRFPDPLRGHQYVVQELVPGSLSITEWVRQYTPTLEEIVSAFWELAELFGELARADIRHRDVKPGNILVTPDGIPKVIDFDSGICVRAEPLTREAASAQPGTHGYVCPELCLAVLEERWTGQRQTFDYSPRSDLHGLGVVFYEVLTGQHPFNLRLFGDEMLQHVAYDQPLHPIKLNDAVPFGLNKVVMRLLAKNPLERYQHGDRVAADLRALLENVADDTWTVPFRLPDTAPEQPVQVPALAARVAEPSVTDGALLPRIPLGSPVGWGPDAPPPVVISLTPRRAPGRRLTVVAAVFVAALVVGSMAGLMWRPSPGPSRVAVRWAAPVASGTRGPMKGEPVLAPVKKSLRKVKKAAALAAATTLCASCASVKVRPEDDQAWLASCPAEARETVWILGLDPGDPNDEGPGVAILEKGPNVIPHKIGCEVREGEISVFAAMRPFNMSGRLYGTIREGSDHASFRFTELKLADGRKFPVCAIAAQSFLAYGPGVPKVTSGGLPASELTPGFIYITTGRIRIRLAPYIPSKGQGPQVN